LQDFKLGDDWHEWVRNNSHLLYSLAGSQSCPGHEDIKEQLQRCFAPKSAPSYCLITSWENYRGAPSAHSMSNTDFARQLITYISSRIGEDGSAKVAAWKSTKQQPDESLEEFFYQSARHRHPTCQQELHD
jgi:hypothetical protein